MVGHPSQGSGSSCSDPVSSAWLGEVMDFSSSVTSNMDTLNRLYFSMRGTRHLHRSWMVPQSTPRGAPDHMAHCWRAWTSPMVLSHLTTWMSLGPWILVGESGKKSSLLKPVRLGGMLHQLCFSFWTAHILKAAACFLTSSWTWGILRDPVLLWWRDLHSRHQLGSSFSSSRYTWTQSVVCNVKLMYPFDR